jgi:hypothetical protein
MVRIRKGYASHVFGALRNAAVNLLRRLGDDQIATKSRENA